MDENLLLTISDLDKLINLESRGLVFCFGTSLVSKIIMAKTRHYYGEIVPSHVLVIYDGKVFESTTDVCTIDNKTIPSGVRRWLLKDWVKSEYNRLTNYYYFPYDKISLSIMENLVHLPYGRDTIVDFLLKDKSEGDRTYGLICSQFANKATGLSKQRCPSPADLFRIVKELGKE